MRNLTQPAPRLGLSVDATLKALLELVTAIGIVAVFAILLIYVFILEQRSRAAAQARQDAFMKQMADIVAAQVKNADAQQEHLELMRLELEAMRQTLTQTSEAKQVVINQNSQALIELKAEYLESVKQMKGAQERIVNDVNAHTDEAQGKTGQAITDAQTANRAQHSEQAEKIEQQMNNLEKAIKLNGETRKAQYDDIQEQLRTMTVTLDALRKDMQTLYAQVQESQAQKDAIEAIGKKVDTLSTAFDQLKKGLTPPPEPPPVDPLANVPPKNEDKEDKHA